MTSVTKAKSIQRILNEDPDGAGLEVDGILGPMTDRAYEELKTNSSPGTSAARHDVYASSFADPADVKAFKKCKAQGKSDKECFKVGDNGIGCWGDSTVQGTGPSCALPPETMTGCWGSKANAKHKKVLVQCKANKLKVTCVLKDQMPSIENLANDAMIDLNPDACAALELEPPIMEPVFWWCKT